MFNIFAYKISEWKQYEKYAHQFKERITKKKKI